MMEVDRESRSRSRTPFIGEVAEMDYTTSTTDATTRKTRRTEKPKPTNGLTNGAQNQSETIKTTTTETETVTVSVNVIKAAKDSAIKSKAKSTVKKVTEKRGMEKKVAEKDITKQKVMQRVETRDYSSDEDTRRTIDAYRAAGDWWEKFPKTDFTYSPASPHHNATVAPGVKTLPNMSRRSLHGESGREDQWGTYVVNRDEFDRNTAATYRAAPLMNLPHAPRSLAEYSDDETTCDAAVVKRTLRTSSTSTTVWTRITTTVVTILTYFTSWVSSVLDWFYLAVAYLRVLDTRILSAIPRRSKGEMFALLMLLLALVFVAWLFLNLAGTPLGETSIILSQWVYPLVAMLRHVTVNETSEGFTLSTAHAATPLPDWEQNTQVPRLTLEALVRDAVASERLASDQRLRKIVQDLGLEMEALRTKMEADLRRNAGQPTTLSAEQIDALASKLSARLAADPDFSARLAADPDFSAKLSANGKFADKLLQQGDLVHKLIVEGELVQKLLVQGELTNQLVTDDKLAERILSDGSFAARLVSDGDLVERLLARGELSSRILTNGDLVERLSTDGELLSKLLADGRLADRLLANGQLVDKLVANGMLTSRLAADSGFADKLTNGKLAEKLLSDGDFIRLLLEDPELKARFSEDEMARALLSNAEFSSKLLADGTVFDRLVADKRFVDLLATKTSASEDERVPELQDRLATLTASLEIVRQQIILLQQTPDSSTTVFDGDVAALVAAMIARYDADKTGRTDYALESLGGSVLSTRCSETHSERAASISLFGLPLWTQASTPRAAIQPGTLPGQCWAFKGARGYLVVKLASQILISSVSIEHMPRALSANGRIDSAPRRMTLWGLTSLEDAEPFPLGEFEFREDGPSLQTFPVKTDADVPAFRIVELNIESNHGNQEYTCLYRFRVHGTQVAV